MDHRIGPYFLNPSPGFGGSCFQKDILNLVYLCQFYGLHEVADYWHQVLKINDYQRDRITNKIMEVIEGSNNKVVTVLGWSFKKNTNDSRESAAIEITDKLIEHGAHINVYDPMVKESRIKEDLNNIWGLKSKSEKDLSDVLEITKNKQIPVLQKDFIIDEYQIYKAKKLGADLSLIHI